MKALFTLLIIGFTASISLAGNSVNPERNTSHRISSHLDSTLSKKEAEIRIQFNEITLDTFTMLYSIDGIASKALMEKGSALYFKTTPGRHKFQFFFNGQFNEAYLNIKIKAQFSEVWNVMFTRPLMIIETPKRGRPNEIQPLKPIIYLYLEKEQRIFVNVKPVGDFTLTYPEINEGWNVLAKPSGELTINEQKYNYLFWESNQQYESPVFQALNGFIVNGNNIISFLEDKLTLAGLNSKEQADFITFWAPRMMHHKSLFIHFDFNETCNKYANLEIRPKPDNLYRIFMT